MKRGEIIGKGHEHKVYPHPSNPNYVIKYPRVSNLLALNVVFGGVQVVQKDIDRVKHMVAHTDGAVEVAETHVSYTWFFSYRMRQRRIESDGSIADKKQRLTDHGLVFLAGRYDSRPENFVDKNGVLYIIDPTLSAISRLVDIYGGEEQYRRFLRKNRALKDKMTTKARTIFKRQK